MADSFTKKMRKKDEEKANRMRGFFDALSSRNKKKPASEPSIWTQIGRKIAGDETDVEKKIRLRLEEEKRKEEQRKAYEKRYGNYKKDNNKDNKNNK